MAAASQDEAAAAINALLAAQVSDAALKALVSQPAGGVTSVDGSPLDPAAAQIMRQAAAMALAADPLASERASQQQRIADGLQKLSTVRSLRVQFQATVPPETQAGLASLFGSAAPSTNPLASTAPTDFPVAKKRRVVPCFFLLAGEMCRRADNCTFSHDPEVIKAAKGEAVTSVNHDAATYKKSYCKFHDAGLCRRGLACSFAHGIEELRGPVTQKNLELIRDGQELAKCRSDAAGNPIDPAELFGKDWICPQCGDHQFARNVACRCCSEPNPLLSGATPLSKDQPPAPPPVVPCYFMLSGEGCRKGSGCNFSHDSEVIKAALDESTKETVHNPATYKRSYCKYFDAGLCLSGAACGFAHGVEELRGEITGKNVERIQEAQALASAKGAKGKTKSKIDSKGDMKGDPWSKGDHWSKNDAWPKGDPWWHKGDGKGDGWHWKGEGKGPDDYFQIRTSDTFAKGGRGKPDWPEQWPVGSASERWTSNGWPDVQWPVPSASLGDGMGCSGMMVPESAKGCVKGKFGKGKCKGDPGGDTSRDWFCPSCGDHQFARNQVCRVCQTPNPVLSSDVPAGHGKGSDSQGAASELTAGAYKKSYCKFFDVGMCKRGAACNFAHGVEELRGDMTTKNLELMREAKVWAEVTAAQGWKGPPAKGGKHQLPWVRAPSTLETFGMVAAGQEGEGHGGTVQHTDWAHPGGQIPSTMDFMSFSAGMI